MDKMIQSTKGKEGIERKRSPALLNDMRILMTREYTFNNEKNKQKRFSITNMGF